MHVLLWLNNVPAEELTMDMPKTIAMAELLMSLYSSLLPRERSQMHQHTHTCYKNNRSVCRFGARFMPSDETMIVMPFPPTDIPEELHKREALMQKYRDMHASLEETQYETTEDFFKKFDITSKQQYVDILRANIDIQVILDHYACTSYVVDYVNKADRGISNVHKAIIKIMQENPERQYVQALKALRVTMLKAIEMWTQEAEWFLLKQEMSDKSRNVKYIPT